MIVPATTRQTRKRITPQFAQCEPPGCLTPGLTARRRNPREGRASSRPLSDGRMSGCPVVLMVDAPMKMHCKELALCIGPLGTRASCPRRSRVSATHAAGFMDLRGQLGREWTWGFPFRPSIATTTSPSCPCRPPKSTDRPSPRSRGGSARPSAIALGPVGTTPKGVARIAALLGKPLGHRCAAFGTLRSIFVGFFC